MVVQYKGTDYYGFQRQPGLPTVQQKLEEVLSSLFNEKTEVAGSGRTDAGVHALHQVVNFRSAVDFPLRRLRLAANSYLPSDISVTDVAEVSADFDARRDAKWREYHYYILNRPFPSPFYEDFSWFIPQTLDSSRIEQSFEHLVGRHDFSAFTLGAQSDRSNLVSVLEMGMVKDDELIAIRIRAKAFITHMVRIILGSLVDVGLGRSSSADIAEILQSRDRRRAGRTAPAKGLTLTRISYGGNQAAREDNWLLSLAHCPK